MVGGPDSIFVRFPIIPLPGCVLDTVSLSYPPVAGVVAVCENDSGVATEIAEALLGLHCEPTIVADPARLVGTVRRIRPDALILDLMLPGVDTLALMAELASIARPPRLILATGASDAAVDEALGVAQACGFADVRVLRKPFGSAEIRAAIAGCAPEPDALDMAVAQWQFALRFQPLLRLADDRVDAAEVLLRWNHPTRGELTPRWFLPALIERGAMPAVTRGVVSSGLALLGSWDGADAPRLSFNVPPACLCAPGFVRFLVQAAAAHAVAPARVMVELTEDGGVRDPAALVDAASRLRAAGFGLSLDDFGSGFSGLARLRDLPVSEVKIDAGFLRPPGAGIVMPDRALLAGIVALARARGAATVCEGVETAAQLDLVRALGIDRAQGFRIGRPMRLPELRQFVATGSWLAQPAFRRDAVDS